MGHEPRSFLCAPGLRIESQERLAELQFAQLNTALEKIESMMERLEKRLWLTVYGVVAVILAQTVQSILGHLP
ncbi:GTA head formation protein, RCAP_rcc01685 family [Rubellimicrobium arenae]|uniref:GTA head formation protein, RCAP_rcc01685 family n=1 Tax=Rubellimicrobium arenae TaxID=2817372 RepID=UPI001B30E20C|nr:hypothetical protein [Rubellimicrobium arenae]